MDDNFTAAAQEALSVNPSDDIVLFTLEIRHSSLEQSIYLVNNPKDIEAKIEDSSEVKAGEVVKFLGYAFDVNLPDKGEGDIKTCRIIVDNVSNDISKALDIVAVSSSKTDLIFRPYLYRTRLNGPEVKLPYVFQLKKATVDTTSVVLTAVVDIFFTKRIFPNLVYRVQDFGGLV